MPLANLVDFKSRQGGQLRLQGQGSGGLLLWCPLSASTKRFGLVWFGFVLECWWWLVGSSVCSFCLFVFVCFLLFLRQGLNCEALANLELTM